MTVKATHIETIETEPEMQPETVLKELRRLAQSPIEVVWKWVFLAVLVMFGWLVWLAFESNQRQPDRLYSLIEKQIMQNTESLKVQERALTELQQLAVRVPLEHQSAEVKLTMIDTNIQRMDGKVDKISADNEALRAAVLANTEAVAKLVKAMEATRADLLTEIGDAAL